MSSALGTATITMYCMYGTKNNVSTKCHSTSSHGSKMSTSVKSSIDFRRRTMDLFDHRYYKFNKVLMKLYGQWPEQSTRVRLLKMSFILSICGTQLIPQIMAILNNLDDVDLLLEAATTLLFAAYTNCKLFFAILNSQKMLMLLNHIRTDWEVWAQDHHVGILHKYAQKARRMTIGYAVMSYIACTIFLLEPSVPKIIDVVLRNGTESGQFPLPLDYYYIDMQKYYFYIILHCFLCSSLGFIFVMTYSCMFIVIVHHGCGLFSALGSKLQLIGKYERSGKTRKLTHHSNKREIDLENLAWCIDRHHDAIEYAKLIEATYTWSFFVIIGINVLGISMLGLQIVKRTVDRQKTIRFVVINLLCMAHLYFDNEMAQSLMDHSISIRSHIFNAEWYNFPLTTQKLLLLMLIRCNVPCKLTSGKITTLCIETFGMFLKTAMSYLTLLSSM